MNLARTWQLLTQPYIFRLADLWKGWKKVETYRLGIRRVCRLPLWYTVITRACTAPACIVRVKGWPQRRWFIAATTTTASWTTTHTVIITVVIVVSITANAPCSLCSSRWLFTKRMIRLNERVEIFVFHQLHLHLASFVWCVPAQNHLFRITFQSDQAIFRHWGRRAQRLIDAGKHFLTGLFRYRKSIWYIHKLNLPLYIESNTKIYVFSIVYVRVKTNCVK